MIGTVAHGPIRYRCNAEYFDTLDSDAKAYWLGFIAADGCVIGNALIVRLALKDGHHLEQLREAMACDRPITIHHYRYSFASFEARSPHLVAALARYGIVPRKSLTLAVPPFPTEVSGAFVRGYFDGDGTIGWYKNAVAPIYKGVRRRYVVIRPVARFMGSEDFIASLRETASCQAITGAVAREKRHSGRIYSFIVDTRHSLKRLKTWMYDGATVCLERKARLFEPLDRARPCRWCHMTFEPGTSVGEFCSKACYQRHMRHSFSWQTERHCALCKSAYIPTRSQQEVCSLPCRRRLSYLRYHV